MPADHAAQRRAAPVVDLFRARLVDLEARVGREVGGSGLGPAGEFVLDSVRSAWTAGSDLASSLSSLAGARAALARWTASAPVDELGFDEDLVATVREVARPLARRWLGLGELPGAPLPDRGGVLVLLNRSAWPLPVEAMVLGAHLADGRLAGRGLAVLWDDGLPELPWWSDLLRRLAVVPASAANASALLERGYVVLAFPEGRAARRRTYDRRYRLARFDDAAVVGAALDAGARVMPGAVVGPEESWPLLGSVAGLPVTAQFPLLGGLGLLPLPGRWRLRLGAAVDVPGSSSSADAVADLLRGRMQAMLGELLAARRDG